MDLFLDLDKKDGIWINGTNRVFEDTEYRGLNFRVKILPLTRTGLRKFKQSSVTRKGVDQDIYLPKIFMSQVIDWELKDGKGQPIPFSEDSKKVLVEQFPGFTNLIAMACLDACAKAEETHEEEVKNLSTSGAGE